MTPLSRSIATWLATGVGTIIGRTPEEAVANAYAQFPAAKSFSQEQFRERLALLGYSPVERSNGWMLHLPEHFGRK